jgi:hypothetical protein
VERVALQPIPPQRFTDFREARRIVHQNGHIEVERIYYSVPPEYLGRGVWGRWRVRRANRMATVCCTFHGDTWKNYWGHRLN